MTEFGEIPSDLPFTVLPTGEEIATRLDAVFDNPYFTEYLTPLLTELGEREVNGLGVTLAVSLAIHDFGERLPEAVRGIGYSYAPKIIEALVDDVDVRDAALAAHEEAVRKANETSEAKRLINDATLPERTELEEPQKLMLVKAAFDIADIVFEHYATDWREQDRPSMGDWREEGVNPFYNQTLGGLMLEFYYGSPNSLWTPWGKYQFGSGGSYTGRQQEEAVSAIMGRLDTTVHSEKKIDASGEHGPIHAVNGVDDVELPVPEVAPKERYIDYHTAKNEWARLSTILGRNVKE